MLSAGNFASTDYNKRTEMQISGGPNILSYLLTLIYESFEGFSPMSCLVWLSFHLYSLLNHISMINRHLDYKVIKSRIIITSHRSILGHVDDAKVPTSLN